jgi:hypothetical protein
VDLTAAHLDTLRHMLGINDPGKKHAIPWRDYAAVNPGDPHYAELQDLGAVFRYHTAIPPNGYDYFSCTPAGRTAAIESHKTIRYSRSRRRYIAYLDISDSLPDLTFREFLTDPAFANIRNRA